MKLLLDTHTFMWMDSAPARLSQTVQTLLQDPANTVLLSVVSIWELAIKLAIGKLKAQTPLTTVVTHQQANGVIVLDVVLAHVLAVEGLPMLHKDPFDRLLIAQAQIEGATLLSADPIVATYPVSVRW